MVPPNEQRTQNRHKKPRLSRMQKPDGMSLEEWQIELRRQFGRQQPFRVRNLTERRVFSEFAVSNPQSGNTYRVTIRGTRPGDNHCTCADFITNTLGTCKHIEFTLARLERTKGGPAALREGYQPPESEVYLHYGAQREVRFRPGSECPIELARFAAKYFGPDSALLPDAFARFDEFVAATTRFDHELRCRDDAVAFIAEVRDGHRRREQLAAEFPRGPKSAAFKKLLKVELYDYQRQGALFAARAGRCLLGDEMGLGKTVQAIAAAEIMARCFGVERVLIVCPTSLKHQWKREIERFCDRSVLVVGGPVAMRRAQIAEPGPFFKITNYDTVPADLAAFDGWSPDLVILDEAQRIKNWATRTARTVKKISAPYAIVLTGTPLENRLEELVSIVQFVDRHRLGPTFRLLHEHQLRDEVGKVTGYRQLDKIGQTLEPILLRRRKSEVLDQLPPRMEQNLFVPMTKEQAALHNENRDTVARIVQKWRRQRFLTEVDQRVLMCALQNMRMSCDSSYLLDPKSEHGIKADELTSLLEELYEETPDAKVVVFSQWLRMHELLARRMQARKWDHVLFHGGVPGPKRGALIDRFRDDPNCRAFLSTDAGGVGLNLQFAQAVVNVDMPWNPAVLEQRIGRVHRLGQRNSVQVVNMVAKGTIEEGMLEILKFKKSLFAGVLDGGATEVFLKGGRLNRFMETVESATAAIPACLAEAAPEEPESTREESDESASGDDLWGGLLQTGLKLFEQFSAAANGPASGSAKIERDAKTGHAFVKFPVPSPKMLEQALTAIQSLLQHLKK